MQLYKSKYGSNLPLYNKFINNINNSIQKSYNKSFFESDKSKNKIFSIDEKNGLIINGVESENEKYINLNLKNNLNNKDYSTSDIKNKKLSQNYRLHISNSFNKAINKNINNNRSDLSKNISNLHKNSNFNITSNDSYLGESENHNHNFISDIKVEKVNNNFLQVSSFNSSSKKIKKSNSQKKNSIHANFDILDKNIFNLNNIIKTYENKIVEEKGRDRNKNKENKDDRSNTFNHPFFKKKSKSQGGNTDENLTSNNENIKTNILNINLFRHKKNYSNSRIHKGIPKGPKINKDINFKKGQNIKSNIEKINKNHISDINNNYLSKLDPLNKITFCYFREISSNIENFSKYNPLKDISSKELCEKPYYFIKSTISLNKNYSSINIVPSTKLEPIDLKIWTLENTLVSSSIKTIIDIHRNYFKWKANNNGNSLLNEFIDEQIKKYNNLNKENIQKCIVNKNFNFSLIINNYNRKEKISKRFEFIICSYDEFKIWINGIAFIIKNKNNILSLIHENIDN